MERIIVAFESDTTCRRISEMLESSGTADCTCVRSCGEVRRKVNKERTNIVVCGYKLSDGNAEDLFEDLPPTCSMLAVAPRAQLELLHEDIFRLPTPVSRGALIASVEMLFQMNRRLSRFVRPQRSQEDKQVVERAKELLMDRSGLTEEQAHRFIQKRSMDSGAKMVQTAQLILDELL